MWPKRQIIQYQFIPTHSVLLSLFSPSTFSLYWCASNLSPPPSIVPVIAVYLHIERLILINPRLSSRNSRCSYEKYEDGASRR